MPSVDIQDVDRTRSPGLRACGQAPRSCVSLPEVVGTGAGPVIANRTHGSILLTGAGCEWTGTSVNL
jgi:hypothetical protein